MRLNARGDGVSFELPDEPIIPHVDGACIVGESEAQGGAAVRETDLLLGTERVG